jgi:hypothetical protein
MNAVCIAGTCSIRQNRILRIGQVLAVQHIGIGCGRCIEQRNGGTMKHKQYGKRYERVDRNGRFTHRKQLQGTACEACSRQLQHTHDYTLYGFLCRACWLAAHGSVEGNDEPGV